MLPVVLLGVAATLIAALANGIVVVPTVRYGVVTRFKKRTSRRLKEGVNLVVPFVDQVQIYPHELRTDSLPRIDVFSKDRLEIVIAGSVQWRPDYNELIRFVEIPENTILVGLSDAIKSELGKIAGESEGDVFIRERKALETLINCIFRLERAPHLHQNPVKSKDKIKSFKMGKSLEEWIDREREKAQKEDDRDKLRKLDKLDPKLLSPGEEWETPILLKVNEKSEAVADCDKEGNVAWDVIGFYNKNAPKVRLMLDVATEVSSIESLYGIDIAVFRLADVDFSSKTREALERKRQAIANLEAAEEQQKRKVEIMKALIELGLTPEQANNAADVIIGVAAPRQVISLEGGGVLPLLNIQPAKKEGEK